MKSSREPAGRDQTAIPEDPIVAEVRAAREALFAEAGYDLGEFVRRLRAAQEHSGHRVIPAPLKVPDDESAAQSVAVLRMR